MVYLDIDEKIFDSLKKEAKEQAKENFGDDAKDELTFTSPLLEETQEELSFDSNHGTINGSFSLKGFKDSKWVDFGYISLDITPDLDLITDIVNYYMKKLGKLKTILEATK